MAFSDFEKKILNGLIDHVVADIGPIVGYARISEIKSMLKERDGFDFSLGVAVTEIHHAFLTGFKMRNGRDINQEETTELFHILGFRMHEIKEGIFKCG